jgi:hypothetical protein
MVLKMIRKFAVRNFFLQSSQDFVLHTKHEHDILRRNLSIFLNARSPEMVESVSINTPTFFCSFQKL